MFRLMKLKPRHSWNAVGWELAIVSLGVLVALAAQQWAENRSSQARAAAADVRIRDELGAIVFLDLERIAIHQCLKQRLIALAEGLRDGRSDWSNFRMAEASDGRWAFRQLYRTPSRNWVSTEYEGSLASGALDSMDLEQTAMLASIYSQIKKQENFNLEEAQLTTQLAILQFGQSMSLAERTSLLATLARLDYLNGLMMLMSRQQIVAYRDLGYHATPDELAHADGMKNWADKVAEMQGKYGACVDPKAELTSELGLAL